MNPLCVAAVAALGSMALTIPAVSLAHHSASAEFQTSVSRDATGVLTKVEMINPHSYLHFDIKNAAGKAEPWSFLSLTPAALRAAGISVRDNLKIGATYRIVYNPARSKSSGNLGILSSIVLPDGRMVSFGSQENLDAARERLKK